MAEIMEESLKFVEEYLKTQESPLKDHLENLAVDYKKKLRRLDTIIKVSDKLELKLLNLNQELDEYKNHLEEKVQQEISKREEKENMLLQQSRLAAMGEMIDAVAHQWKQPLNVIQLQSVVIELKYKKNLLDDAYIDKFKTTIEAQVDHMNNTLNTFRNFVRPTSLDSTFDVKEMLDKALLLLKGELKGNMIEIETNTTQNFHLAGNENEFIHLILNIINNAKDAFNEKEIKVRKLIINLLQENNIKSIEIIDNAGGIPSDIIDDIFKSNVTTKEKGKGTGVGLYMSSLIAQKHNGTLVAQNVENGAKFTFSTAEI